MKKKVAIVGAAGFVGIELVSQLEKISTFELFAVTRDNGNFILHDKQITLIQENDIEVNGPFDFVVNLAYPTISEPHFVPQVNQNILNSIRKLTSKGTKIIHVSTQAVFGFGMDIKVKNEFMPNRRDFTYIESKLEMENLVRKTFSDNSIAVIRLGNVWGPGSGTWTASLADKLIFGQYVGIEEMDGYCNITDVKNVVSYIIFLLVNDKVIGTEIYHLAEFSSHRWSEVINEIANILNVKPIYSDTKPKYPLRLTSDIVNALKIPGIGDTYREIMAGRFGASYLRSIVRLIGKGRFQKVKRKEVRTLPTTSKFSKKDLIFLEVTTSTVEFKSILADGWIPAIDFKQSIGLVKDWLIEAGYI